MTTVHHVPTCGCVICTAVRAKQAKQPTQTMTPGEREELARDFHGALSKIDVLAYLDMPDSTPDRLADAIAPVIERMVAERVAAETERCAKVAESFEPKSCIKDWRDGYETARNYIAFAIRSTTR